MTWTIKSHSSDSKPATFCGHTLPLLIEDGPVPVLIVEGISVNHRVIDENGERAKAFVVLSLYLSERNPVHAIHVTAHNSGGYGIEHIDNQPQPFDSLNALIGGFKDQILDAKSAALKMPVPISRF
jgi:hypothetical protein